MIYNTNKIFGKVWKATPAENGKYIDFQITTSEKATDGETWINSGWFPRAIGHAANTLKSVKAGDRITITKSKFTNERYTDNDGTKKSRFRFLILEGSVENEEKETSSATQKPKVEKEAPSANDECPW